MTLWDQADFAVSHTMLDGYLGGLVNHFFKILPIWESGEKTLPTYMKSLRAELLGCISLVDVLREDASFLSLAAILQYLIDHPELERAEVKREVFKAISILNRLKQRYGFEPEEGGVRK